MTELYQATNLTWLKTGIQISLSIFERQNLKLDEDDFNITHRKKIINGLSFLEMTEKKFEHYSLEDGPAILLISKKS
ncbi:hypothetical protein C1645_826630 [Glomus cerebriforme]|uniref:Uncharacterized protein n=1 Tax=Glomus cerebriforme TaxID=658196 RepID=A0A397SZC2_9GLOM|nr:hypothetical protein C1645_826630 [Glomus cerebriforme]